MKKLVLVGLVFCMCLSFAGCGKSTADPQKYVKMAIDYIYTQVPVDISETKYYVKVSNKSEDYSYYSTAEKKDVTEYENIVARVYLKGESVPYPIVVFIGENAEKEYDAKSGDWSNVNMFFKLSKEQTDAATENNYSGEYVDAVKVQMWNEQNSKNEAFVPTDSELNEWIIVTDGELK